MAKEDRRLTGEDLSRRDERIREADNLYNNKEYEAAKRIYEIYARIDSYASRRLGWMYANGEGVEKDLKQAAYLYQIQLN